MSNRTIRSWSLVGILTLTLGILALAMLWLAGTINISQAAPTATLYVNAATGNDGNDCLSAGAACATIDAAIGKAIANDSIQIAAGTYNENDIALSKELTLIGAGAGSTIVDGGDNGRIFDINLSSIISNLTIQNGQTPSDANAFISGGGAVFVGTNTTTLLQNVVISNSVAAGSGVGGGIYNYSFWRI
ncbi:MAG: hypothetical protein GY805_04515 [Chloroflexi bacterium]|nr:hypothetical protein [Chloroflexota bacterium]